MFKMEIDTLHFPGASADVAAMQDSGWVHQRTPFPTGTRDGLTAGAMAMRLDAKELPETM